MNDLSIVFLTFGAVIFIFYLYVRYEDRHRPEKK